MAAPPYDVATLEQAQARLVPAVEILDGFHYRNKNQHRLARWWAELDMLRRAARKLARDLQRSAASATRARDRPRKQRVAAVAAATAADGASAARARHLREHLVPRAYMAFTQLAADNQYAQLGLALIGVLAQVEEAASRLAPREAAGDEALPARVAGPREPCSRAAETDDLGVAVARRDVAPSSTGAEAFSGAGTETKAGVGAREEDDGAVSSLSPPPQGGTNSSKGPEVSGRPTKQGRDEFDKLSGSLQSKKSSSKKKKRKKDEFDQLFGSLI